MKNKQLLIIAQKRRKPSIDSIYQQLLSYFSATSRIVKIEPHDYPDLHKALTDSNAHTADVVFFDMPHHYMRTQHKAINRLPVRVLYEQDACQEFMPDSRWKGDFSHFYSRIPETLILNTGHYVVDQLQLKGVYARYVPKGFDPAVINDLDNVRDIDLGFIGAFRSDTYIQRYRLVDFMQLKAGLKILRTAPGHDYNLALNRIRIFFSADAGIGEYMHKNFEAMAAGCLLLAWRQGNNEEERLGLIDGENCLLYTSEQEALEKYRWAMNNHERLHLIAKKGREHALTHFTFSHIADAMATAITEYIQAKTAPQNK